MNKSKIEHHLNCIKMCQSDKAIRKRIETIFTEGNENGWKESAQCVRCLETIPELEYPDQCDDCRGGGR